jgi:hypothetical protein
MGRSILIEKLFIRVCTCDVQTRSGLILTLHVILSSDELALVPRAAHRGKCDVVGHSCEHRWAPFLIT